MPIMKCQKDGKSGYKYGESGHCYTGPGAREKARKQGQAIEISKHKAERTHDIVRELVDAIVNAENKNE